MQDLMTVLLSRTSASAFAEPGPSEEQLELMLAAAVRAPDHGKLRPWRFYVIRGEARQRLSELFVRALLRRDPQAPEALREKDRVSPLRAPLVIAVAAVVTPGHKIPEIEQVVAAGAAAMNILNAAHALGFGAKWVTGPNCYDAAFRRDFGLGEREQLLGFLHVGTSPAVAVARPAAGEFTVEWQGPVG